MKYEVTKEQILEAHADACNEWKEKLEEWFPKVFEQKCEVGKWYWASENARRNKSFLFYCNGEEITYGFGFDKLWSNCLEVGDNNTIGVEATNEEVRDMLIMESKRIGYNEVNIISVRKVSGSSRSFNKNFDTWTYYDDSLYTESDGAGGYIAYSYGKWAEKNTSTVKVSKSDIAKLMNVEVSNLKIVD